MYVESAARFRRIAEMQPSWQNQYNLALALVKAKQTKEALPLLASLTAEHATDANLLSDIASTYESAGESSLALDAWQKAIAADPANPDRYLDCTRMLIDLDRYKEATEIVQRGISLVPDDYPLTIRLGAIEMMTGDHAQARDTFRKAIAEHPALALGYVAVAQSYMKDGKDEEALKVLDRCTGRSPARLCAGICLRPGFISAGPARAGNGSIEKCGGTATGGGGTALPAGSAAHEDAAVERSTGGI